MENNLLNSKWSWDKSRFMEDTLKMNINKEDLWNSNHDYFFTEDEDFINEEYKNIVTKVFENFKIQNDDKNKLENFLENNITAKIIVYAQYFSGAPSLKAARMISYVNMTNFISAQLSKELCGHEFGMGLMERLQYLFRFYSYRKEVYVNCIAKIALASLRDHKYDIEKDMKENKGNNPFITKEINDELFKEYEQGLINIIENNNDK